MCMRIKKRHNNKKSQRNKKAKWHIKYVNFLFLFSASNKPHVN